MSSVTLMRFLPATANSCETFSLLPVRVFTSSVPSASPAADHAEIGDLADVLFHLALEDECHGGLRSRRPRSPRLRSRGMPGAFCGPGRHVDDELHQTLGADVALAAGAEDEASLRVSRRPIFRPERMSSCVSVPFVEIELHERLVVSRRPSPPARWFSSVARFSISSAGISSSSRVAVRRP